MSQQNMIYLAYNNPQLLRKWISKNIYHSVVPRKNQLRKSYELVDYIKEKDIGDKEIYNNYCKGKSLRRFDNSSSESSGEHIKIMNKDLKQIMDIKDINGSNFIHYNINKFENPEKIMCEMFSEHDLSEIKKFNDFEHGEVDFVSLINILHYLEDWKLENLLKKTFKSLKDGGYLLIRTYDCSTESIKRYQKLNHNLYGDRELHQLFSRRKWNEILNNYGFEYVNHNHIRDKYQNIRLNNSFFAIYRKRQCTF